MVYGMRLYAHFSKRSRHPLDFIQSFPLFRYIILARMQIENEPSHHEKAMRGVSLYRLWAHHRLR